MEYLILGLVIIGLYFVIPCKITDLYKKKCDDEEMDGGTYSGDVKVTKKKTRKRTATKARKKVTKRKTKK